MMRKEYDEDIYVCAKSLWNYLILGQKLVKSDCILVFGGHDPSVAIHAANLFKAEWAPIIIVSGGVIQSGHYYGINEDLIEAKALEKVLLREGVKKESIILEEHAHNTSENFWFTRDLIEKDKLNMKRFILVQKPYTERRTFLTGQNRWPDKEIIMSSMDISFEDYLDGDIEQKKIIDMMVGEVHRIKEYPKLGYFKEQIIPQEISDAFEHLKQCGFDSRIK